LPKLATKVKVCVPIQGGLIGGITAPSGEFCVVFLLKSVDHLDALALREQLIDVLTQETSFLEFGRTTLLGLNSPTLLTSEDLAFKVSERTLTRLFNVLSKRLARFGLLLSVTLKFGAIELTIERLTTLSHVERKFLKAVEEIVVEESDE